MASPQCEDGYTRLANELLEALMQLRIPGQELRIVLAVSRLTFGWRKKSDQISYGQLSRMTDIPRPRVIEHVKNLVSKMILGSHNNGTRKPLTLWINKDFEDWQPSPKKETSPNHVTISSPKDETSDGPNNVTSASPNNVTHQRKERKGKKGKETPQCSQPTSQAPAPSEQFQRCQELSRKFLEAQQANFPKSIKQIRQKDIDNGAGALDKLVRLDGYDLEHEILPALRFAYYDDFWSKNLLSLASLRREGKNGCTKFVNILARMESGNGKDVQPQTYAQAQDAEERQRAERVLEKLRRQKHGESGSHQVGTGEVSDCLFGQEGAGGDLRDMGRAVE